MTFPTCMTVFLMGNTQNFKAALFRTMIVNGTVSVVQDFELIMIFFMIIKKKKVRTDWWNFSHTTLASDDLNLAQGQNRQHYNAFSVHILSFLELDSSWSTSTFAVCKKSSMNIVQNFSFCVSPECKSRHKLYFAFTWKWQVNLGNLICCLPLFLVQKSYLLPLTVGLISIFFSKSFYFIVVISI